MVAKNVEKAKGLVALGIAVFPVLVTPDPENPYKTRKRPAIPFAHGDDDPSAAGCTGQCGKRGHGFYDATLDPGFVEDLFERYPRAEVGVYMGKSGLMAADFDVKRDPEGNVLVDGFENFEEQWLPLPETYSFDSISGAGGKQFIYAAPEGLNLARKSDYRKIKGLDRQSGESYSVWAGDVPASRDVFKPAPEWLCDASEVRSIEKFEGTVKDWYDTLEPGEPNVVVRKAMDRAREHFEALGNDFSHSDIVERTFEAIRLGSEGHTGVPDLLALLEELFYARTGAHTRSEDEWQGEFMEALASGIEKYGAAIQLRKDLPEYSLALVPGAVPDRLISGAPAGKNVFSELLAALLPVVADDLTVTSILWNSPRTRDLAREWGVEFVHQRVQDARTRPEPTRENPTLEVTPKVQTEGFFLTDDEKAVVASEYTFIDRYLAASSQKGYFQAAYDIPAAWTVLSMAFGGRAVIPLGMPLTTNLWFLVLGYSGTGKSTADNFMSDVLNLVLRDEADEVPYSLGAHSSPEGLHEALLGRDGKASVVHHDEASDFFKAVKTRDWMTILNDLFAKWYTGKVDPMQKVRLKELRGKSAKTSFNIHMLATPDRLTSLLDTEMFATGFLARFNWVWGPPPVESDDKYRSIFVDLDQSKLMHPAVFELAADVSHASTLFGDDPVTVTAESEATARLTAAFKAFDMAAKKHDRYILLEPALVRHRETLWKMAALLALYEGLRVIEVRHVLVAIHYGELFFENLIRVVEATGESEFSRDVTEMEAWIEAKGGMVSEPQILHRFRGKIKFSPRELQDRLEFLVTSGRVNRSRVDDGKRIVYETNGR